MTSPIQKHAKSKITVAPAGALVRRGAPTRASLPVPEAAAAAGWRDLVSSMQWRIVAASLIVGLLIVGGTIAAITARNHKYARNAAATAPAPVIDESIPTPPVVPPSNEAKPAAPVSQATDTPAPPAESAAAKPAPRKRSSAFTSAGRLGGRVGTTPKAPPEPIAEKPAAPTRAAEPEKPAPLVIKRRFAQPDAEDLRRQLILAPEMKLYHIPPESRRLLASAPKTRKYAPDEMPDFAGLPMRMGIDCQLGKESAENLQVLSQKLRTFMANATEVNARNPIIALAADPRPNAETLRGQLAIPRRNEAAPNRVPAKLNDLADDWLKAEAIPTLTQMLMAENKPLRLLLVDILARIKGREASAALAQRALFDLSAEVREAAIQVLNNRPAAEYRAKLLEGLRYPWAPVADHAAEALASLNDRQAIAELIDLLDAPDPQAPTQSLGQRLPTVREVVAINHLGNCSMCHAQSLATTDPVRGQIPSPRQPLPPPVQYYDNGTGPFVRADVTYLRQDFSVPQPVSNPGAWPTSQRFDYMVRNRTLSSNEIVTFKFQQTLRERDLRELARKEEPRCEQRDAVLFALRELTGVNVGSSSARWREYAVEEGLARR